MIDNCGTVHCIACVIITDHPLKSLNNEIVGSITFTRFLCVNESVSVSFRTVSDF